MANQEQRAEMLARKDMTEIMGAEGWDIPVEEIQDPEMAAGSEGISDAGVFSDSDLSSGTEILPGSAGSVISSDISGGSGSFGSAGMGGSTYPQVIPNSPTFRVPANPLLPPKYNEVLDYNAVQYLNGIFRTQIGRYVKVSQLVGSNTMEEFEGYLIGVGINYIILQDYITGNIRILDIYGIKSMYVYYKNVRSLLSED